MISCEGRQMVQHWQLERYGREHLALVEGAPGEPGSTEVVVRVRAAALNYRDLLMLRDGMGMDLQLPFVPGSDMSGEVIATGARVRSVAPGDHVIGTFWAG